MPKKLIGYLYPEEIMEVFQAVDLKKTEGFRDYCLLGAKWGRVESWF
jgi:hypothetical protein